MPESFEYPKGTKLDRETMERLGGEGSTKLTAKEIRARIDARDAGSKKILDAYRKDRGL